MALIAFDLDLRIRVVQPVLIRRLSNNTRKALTDLGEFTFKEPPQIQLASGPRLSGNFLPELSLDELATKTAAGLKEMCDRFEAFGKLIDERCKHIVISYDPDKKGQESITESCLKVFGLANGIITYDMYRRSLQYSDKLDKFLAHRSIENEGFLDGS